jgi:hypothetical protein
MDRYHKLLTQELVNDLTDPNQPHPTEMAVEDEIVPDLYLFPLP